MTNKAITDAPWLEIIPPPPPAGPSTWLILLALLAVTLLFILLYRYWLARPEQQARRQIKQLQQKLSRQQLDSKHCLFEINRLLCLGLQQPHLANFKPPHQQNDWQQFYRALTRQQYRHGNPDTDETLRLILAASHLLKELNK